MDKTLPLKVRANSYNLAFAKYPGSHLVCVNDCISAVWMLGNNYKGSGYYGAYPPQYVNRVMSLFPDAKSVMHLFSGSMPHGKYIRVDCQEVNGERPEILCNAEHLAPACKGKVVDLIMADPPYSKEDATHYNTKMVNRKKVLEQCSAVLQPGGFVVWLDTVWPMIHKKHLVLVGVIGILRSQNHRVRFSFIMRKPT